MRFSKSWLTSFRKSFSALVSERWVLCEWQLVLECASVPPHSPGERLSLHLLVEELEREVVCLEHNESAPDDGHRVLVYQGLACYSLGLCWLE